MLSCWMLIKSNSLIFAAHPFLTGHNILLLTKSPHLSVNQAPTDSLPTLSPLLL
jgi:hypothetical protein